MGGSGCLLQWTEECRRGGGYHPKQSKYLCDGAYVKIEGV